MATMDPVPGVSRRSTRTDLGPGHAQKVPDEAYANSDEESSNSDTDDEKDSTGCSISAEHTKIINIIKKSREPINIEQTIAQRNTPEWTQVDATDQSLLDKLLANDYKLGKENRKVVAKLCEWLAEQQPQLLTVKRRPKGLPYQTTAFYLGFNPNNGRPMDRLLRKFLSKKSIQAYDILTTKCGTEGDTCLHVAVMAKKPLVDLLLSDSSALSLAEKRNLIIQQDKSGLTPLHIAVSLNISPERRDHIRKMVDFCKPEDLLIEDHEGRTPLHLAVACADKNLKARITGKEIRDQDNPKYADSHLDALKILVEKQPEALRKTTKLEKRSPYQYRLSISNSKSIGPISNPSSCPPSPTDPISFYLIDEYMHLDSYDDTIKYLYGACTKDVVFDICEENPRYIQGILTPRGLGKMNYWNFEQILRYVAIPEYTRSTSASKLSEADQKEKGNGRVELVEVFGWLKRRGVRKIIQVIVHDSADPPHADESIEKALSQFEVEKLDWKKDDIDIDTIKKAVPKAKELRLYSSGNKSVLRSWSSENGLATMCSLENLHIEIRQCYDSYSRIAGHKRFFEKEFEGSLKKNSRNRVRYKVEILSVVAGRNHSGLQLKGTGVPVGKGMHDWFVGMERFTSWLGNYISPDDETGNTNTQITPIKIALIDDGVDGTIDLISEKLKAGISFHKIVDNLKRSRVLSYCSAGGSHGTTLATLICQVCPEVDLYVARLQCDHSRRIMIDSAIKGIKWAVEQDVDIISMSWTFEKTKSNETAIGQLEAVIDEANKKNILMFNSVPDLGLIGPGVGNIYPTCLRDSGIIRIGAAIRSGNPSLWSGADCDYVLPGENIVIDPTNTPCWPTEENAIDYASHVKGGSFTGSSYATALAAGVAALVLLCQDPNMIGAGKIDKGTYRTYRRIKKAFDTMGTQEKAGGPQFINPWEKVFTDRLGDINACDEKSRSKLADVMKQLL